MLKLKVWIGENNVRNASKKCQKAKTGSFWPVWNLSSEGAAVWEWGKQA